MNFILNFLNNQRYSLRNRRSTEISRIKIATGMLEVTWQKKMKKNRSSRSVIKIKLISSLNKEIFLSTALPWNTGKTILVYLSRWAGRSEQFGRRFNSSDRLLSFDQKSEKCLHCTRYCVIEGNIRLIIIISFLGFIRIAPFFKIF